MLKIHAIEEQTIIAESFCKAVEKISCRDKILLVSPPLFSWKNISCETAKMQGYATYPPNGLLHLAAAIHQYFPDIEIKFLDLNLSMIKLAVADCDDIGGALKHELFSAIGNRTGSLVGINFMFATSEESSFEVAEWIHETKNLAFFGGVQATFDSDRILNLGKADFLMRFEAEDTINHFFSYLYNETSDNLNMLFNISFAIDGVSYHLPEKRFNSVPLSIIRYLENIKIEEYSKFGSLSFITKAVGANERFFTVLSNRGCRAHCTFCSVRSFNGKGVVRRSIDSVISEIEYLIDKKGVTLIDWLDDDLFFDRELTQELFNRMADKFSNRLKWVTNNAVIAAAITDDILEAASNSGCVHLGFGIESGNDKRLKSIRKPTTKRKIREVYGKLKKSYSHILVTANLMLGFPNETILELAETYAFGLELENDWVKVCITQPLKGTSMYSVFAELCDPRAEKDTADNYSVGRQIQREGASNIFGEDIGFDVFFQDETWVPNYKDIRELWYFLTADINFIYNKNLTSRGDPSRFLNLALPLIDMYGFDPLIFASVSEAHRMLGNTIDANKFYATYKEKRDDNTHFSNIFDKFCLDRVFDADERENRKLAFGGNQNLNQRFLSIN